MFARILAAGALGSMLAVAGMPAGAQDGRREAAESYAAVVDYTLLIENAAKLRAATVPASERKVFIEFITKKVDFEMTRFYAINAMVDIFDASELQALVSFAATPAGGSALAKLPALGAILSPIVERQVADAERDYLER